jgi:hypothetical protein
MEAQVDAHAAVCSTSSIVPLIALATPVLCTCCTRNSMMTLSPPSIGATRSYCGNFS